MRCSMRMGLWLVVCSTSIPAAAAQEPPARPKAKVEFRWIEGKPIKGVTEEKGVRTSCGDELSYLHKQAFLTSADVAEARLRRNDFRASNNGIVWDVQLQFTAVAKQKLVAACGDKEARSLAIVIDGRYQSLWYFRKAEADKFRPFAGFFSSQAEAERVLAAFERSTEQ